MTAQLQAPTKETREPLQYVNVAVEPTACDGDAGASSRPRTTKSHTLLGPIVVAFIGICYVAWAIEPNYSIRSLGLYLLLAIIAAFVWNGFTKK